MVLRSEASSILPRAAWLVADWDSLSATVLRVRDLDSCIRGLAADTPEVSVGRGSLPPGFRELERYVALPTAGDPKLLVQTSPAGAAAHAVTTFANGSGVALRLASRAAAAGIRVGAMRVVPGERITIGVADGTDEARLPQLLLRRHLAEILGRDDLVLAMRVGAMRPNGKPVVQVMDPRGDAIGFVKIGWNDLTRPLVRREGEVLAELSEPGRHPTTFSVPRLIHRDRWHEYELLLVEPIGESGQFSGPGAPLQPTREVAGIGGVTRVPLAASTWWQAIRERLEAAPHPTLGAAVDELERRSGERELPFGGCHGDWTPWNMTRRGGMLMVWDWERFQHGAPIGLDAIHYAFMVSLRRRKRPHTTASQDALEATPPLLQAMGVGPDDGPTVLMLHQLEMAVRYAEARAAGVDVRRDTFADELSRLLRET